MVSRKTDERKAVEPKADKIKSQKKVGVNKSRKKLNLLIILWVFLSAFTIVCLVLLLIISFGSFNNHEDEALVGECPGLNGEVINSNECLTDKDDVTLVDFQNVINDWTSSIDGEKGIIIYDLMAGKIVGEYNPDEKFATASLYKLFVVYVGYQKVDKGEWDGNDMAGGTGRTIIECLDLAIRESYSPCAETLWAMIGRDDLDEVIQSKPGLIDVVVGSLSATPREIMRIMLDFYQHTDISDENLVIRMKDSFLNQPITTYNWRQGLPSGFSGNVHVYNKVGWHYNGRFWEIYDDAAIVDFYQAKRSFVVVVMTSGVDFKNIRHFGELLEEDFISQTD